MFGLLLAARIAFAAQVAAAPATANSGKTIVRRVSHKQEISIVATSSGVRYSATDEHGQTLVSNATLDELKQKHPEVYRQLAPALCTTADRRPTIYAGLDD